MEQTNCPQVDLLADVRPIGYWDFASILSWFELRGLKKPEKWAFSDIGYMVPDVAAGFLYTTNSGMAVLDMFITNPKASSVERLRGLRSVRTALIWRAQEMAQVKMLCCDTDNQTIKSLAEEADFLPSGQRYCFYKKF